MDEAVRRTYLLARDLLDYLPGIGTSLKTQSGPAASKRVPCAVCAAKGRMSGPYPCAVCAPRIGPKAGPPHRPRHGCTPCGNCEGTGWRRRRVADAEHDEYLGLELRSANRKPLEKKLWEREQDTARQLNHVEFLLRLWAADESIDEAWEEARRRQFSSGSYPELVAALWVVSERWPNRFSLLWRAVVLKQADLDRPERGLLQLSDSALGELNATLHYIGHQLMPPVIRVPAHLYDAPASEKKRSLWRGRTPLHGGERARRDELIRHQHLELGWKTARIARFHAIERRRVNQILARADG